MSGDCCLYFKDRGKSEHLPLLLNFLFNSNGRVAGNACPEQSARCEQRRIALRSACIHL